MSTNPQQEADPKQEKPLAQQQSEILDKIPDAERTKFQEGQKEALDQARAMGAGADTVRKIELCDSVEKLEAMKQYLAVCAKNPMKGDVAKNIDHFFTQDEIVQKSIIAAAEQGIKESEDIIARATQLLGHPPETLSYEAIEGKMREQFKSFVQTEAKNLFTEKEMGERMAQIGQERLLPDDRQAKSRGVLNQFERFKSEWLPKTIETRNAEREKFVKEKLEKALGDGHLISKEGMEKVAEWYKTCSYQDFKSAEAASPDAPKVAGKPTFAEWVKELEGKRAAVENEYIAEAQKSAKHLGPKEVESAKQWAKTASIAELRDWKTTKFPTFIEGLKQTDTNFEDALAKQQKEANLSAEEAGEISKIWYKTDYPDRGQLLADLQSGKWREGRAERQKLQELGREKAALISPEEEAKIAKTSLTGTIEEKKALTEEMQKTTAEREETRKNAAAQLRVIEGFAEKKDFSETGQKNMRQNIVFFLNATDKLEKAGISSFIQLRAELTPLAKQCGLDLTRSEEIEKMPLIATSNAADFWRFEDAVQHDPNAIAAMNKLYLMAMTEQDKKEKGLQHETDTTKAVQQQAQAANDELWKKDATKAQELHQEAVNDASFGKKPDAVPANVATIKLTNEEPKNVNLEEERKRIEATQQGQVIAFTDENGDMLNKEQQEKRLLTQVNKGLGNVFGKIFGKKEINATQMQDMVKAMREKGKKGNQADALRAANEVVFKEAA